MVITNRMWLCGLGTLALTAVAVSACGGSSSGGSSSSGAGGSTGAVSPSSSTSSGLGGGSPASTTSGSPASSSAASGSSSSGASMGCAMGDPPPGATILTAGDGGLSVIGGVTAYGGTAEPTVATNASGALIVTENGAASATAPEYVGAVLYFSGNTAGTDCIDASTYTGVEFTISGSLAGCTIQFSINDSEHTAMSATDPKAGGAAGSYAPQLGVTVTTTPTMLQVPFTGASAPTGGMPAMAIDPTKLEAIQWQFTIAAGAETCASTLTIDDIAFYH